MWVTSRDEAKGARAVELGADGAYPSGARLPDRVDAVMETVGAPTWEHSLKSLRPGGTIVVSGATGGHEAVSDLRRLFFLQLRVVGSTMGTRDELVRLTQLLVQTGVRPLVDTELPLDRVREGFARMDRGELFGKVVFTVGG
jgi:NADPH:quinone reductase-like Zn-dependent oxidoreductase